MRTLSISAILLSAVSLGACVSATSEDSFEQVEQRYVPLAQDVASLASEQGNSLYSSLPVGTTGRYNGLLLGNDLCNTGTSPQCSGPAVEYIAKLLLNVNFGPQTVTGSLSEFVTKLANFKSPSGVIQLTGSVCDARYCEATVDPNGYAYISFEGSGELVGANGNIAFYWLKSGSPSGADLGADGALGGYTGQVMAGDFGSDFQWLAGTYIGKISGSDGQWVAMLQ